MTIKTIKRFDSKTKLPSPGKLVKDLFNDVMYEFIDYEYKEVTYGFNILNFNFGITMDFKTAGEHRAEIISALENRHYQGLIVWLDDYLVYHSDNISCSIRQTIKDNKKLKNIHYNTVEEVQEALRLLFIALQDADLPL